VPVLLASWAKTCIAGTVVKQKKAKRTSRGRIAQNLY
jgi:hypothetical protein